MTDHTTTATALTVTIDAAQCDSIWRVLDEARRVVKVLGDYACAKDTEVIFFCLETIGTALAEAGLHCNALFHVEEALEAAYLAMADLLAAHGIPVETTEALDDSEPGCPALQAPRPEATLELGLLRSQRGCRSLPLWHRTPISRHRARPTGLPTCRVSRRRGGPARGWTWTTASCLSCSPPQRNLS